MRQRSIFNRFFWRLFATFFCCSLLSVTVSLPALALTVFSPLVELETDPGQTQSGLLKVFNETDHDLVLTASIEPFAAGDESGRPVFSPAGDNQHLAWFALSQESILLQPKQAAIVPFTVTVPATATPGGYYAVIFWQTPPGFLAGVGAVGLSEKVGTLIFLKVNGAVVEAGQILDFTTVPDQPYLLRSPTAFSVRFENQGNIHFRPTGEITIAGWLGRKTLPFNSQTQSVLPQSVRRFETVWQSSSDGGFKNFFSNLGEELTNGVWGRVTATLSVRYGVDNPQMTSEQISFWIIPVRSGLVALSALIIIILWWRINRKVTHLKRQARGFKKK